MTDDDYLARHRGPYRLVATRRTTVRREPYRTDWLTGAVEREDLSAEALALLTDPRDTIVAVDVWSVTEQQFVHTYRGATP